MDDELPWPPRREDLERLYVVEELSAAKVAERYHLEYKNPKVAESTILYHLRRNGIPRRDPDAHVRKVTEAMVDDWVRRYQAGESLKQIAAIAVSPATVFLHLRKRGIELRDKAEAQIQAVTKYEKRPFSGDGIEKAYLMGLRYGDLDVVRHGRAVRVRVSTTHPAMAELFESLFSPYAHVSWYPRTAPLTGYEWTLECDLDPSFEFLLQKLDLEVLKHLNESQFIAFFAGFFDAEGTVALHRKKLGFAFEAYLTNSNATLLELLADRLRHLGYSPLVREGRQGAMRLGYLKEGEVFRLFFFKGVDVCGLLKTVPLRHNEKQCKAIFVVENFCAGRLKNKDMSAWQNMTRQIKRDRDYFVDYAKTEFLARHGAPRPPSQGS